MSLSCSLQVIDFSNFYLEKETKQKGLSLDHSDYWHLLVLPVHDTIFTLFSIYLFHFIFFWGGGGGGKNKKWVIPEKIHTLTTEGACWKISPEGGLTALEIQTRGGL